MNKIHVFTNGGAIIEFGGKASEREVENMREMWQKYAGDPPTLIFGEEVEVIIHPVPLAGNQSKANESKRKCDPDCTAEGSHYE